MGANLVLVENLILKELKPYTFHTKFVLIYISLMQKSSVWTENNGPTP